MKKILAVLVIILFVFAGIIILIVLNDQSEPSQVTEPSTFSTGAGKVGEMSREDSMYISDNLKDKPIPTNTIWSSTLFNGKIEGLYTFPFVSRIAEGKLVVTVPVIVPSARVVTAQDSAFRINIAGSKPITSAEINDYSDLGVSYNLKGESGETILTADFVQGSPYVLVSNYDSININIDDGDITENTEDTYYYRSKSRNELVYGVRSNNTIKNDGEVIKIDSTNSTGVTSVFVADNTTNLKKVGQYAFSRPLDVRATGHVEGGKAVTTLSLNYDESRQSETVLGILPSQKVKDGQRLFSLNSIRGEMSFYLVGRELEVETDAVEPVEELEIKNLTEEDKDLIKDKLKEDIQFTTPSTGGSYFGGKRLARTARLIEIADAIGDEESKKEVLSTLKNDLIDWFDYKTSEKDKYFLYDPQMKGLVAYSPEFDSDSYNDHHFHYGYFIYASSVLAKYDQDFKNNYSDFVDLIIRDIAATNPDDGYFPYMRNFDFYEGHSWASGFLFGPDGNNQESTSEAINAWYAMWKWSKVTGDEKLENWSQYLYSEEVNSAKYYWLNHDNFIGPDQYEFDKASIIWGGKYEYNTFFSQDPLAIEGIQYLPFTPGSLYLYDPEIIERDYQNIKSELDYDDKKIWLDLNYMYYGMNRGFDIASQEQLDKVLLDDGNSRSNLFYWLMYWDHK